jgi:hypothetical protein
MHLAHSAWTLTQMRKRLVRPRFPRVAVPEVSVAVCWFASAPRETYV